MRWHPDITDHPRPDFPICSTVSEFHCISTERCKGRDIGTFKFVRYIEVLLRLRFIGAEKEMGVEKWELQFRSIYRGCEGNLLYRGPLYRNSTVKDDFHRIESFKRLEGDC